MDNLRSVLSIVLSKIPSGEILNDAISYDNITGKDFVKIAGYYVKNYSNDELNNMFCYLCNEYEEQADYVRGYAFVPRTDRESFSIFDAILIFAVRVLMELDGEPVCRYKQMLRWRMTSYELDEDIFTTAYLAFQDIRRSEQFRSFSWRPVIRHNNEYLNKILSQGLADNHFHLKGSAPQFPLSWISMMNCVTSRKFHKLLDRYSDERLSTIYFTGKDEEHLYVSFLKAALIRSFLFAKLVNQEFIVELDDMGREVFGDKEKRSRYAEQKVRGWLGDREEILFHRNEIQMNISYFKTLSSYREEELDYALNGNYDYRGTCVNENFVLSGERWFMYSMFRKIYSKNAEMKPYFNMFYAYLVIKATIRSELVQTNNNIGFDNFERYQERKEDFIENTPFEEHYIRMALKGTIKNQGIIHQEVRISPKETAEKDRNYIRKFDNILKNEKELKKAFFYVFHFIKEKDDPRLMETDVLCRHYEKRKNLRKQALAIACMREQYPAEACRLRGIDACAKEIGCRPEVFAQTYRFLRNHMVYQQYEGFYEKSDTCKASNKVRQLSMTYHVGEDYLDIIDGLRSIEEAIQFLRLNCGSRMGHALALGVDVEQYYEAKKYKLLISQQDYLDNLVWLYYRIKKFSLVGFDDILLFVEQEYDKYFRLIYGNFICDTFFESVIKTARTHFRKKDQTIVEGYCNSKFYFRISEYYAAWKLRGDDPKCYKNGYFEEISDISRWNYYAVNRKFPEDYRSRYNPECAYLYYLYHYCGKAKAEGAKVIEIRISHRMVQCVKQVQKEMQKWISSQGIGIESNPSSNYLIGTFSRYDQHPIFNLYNIGLTTNGGEMEECPQIPVCINTDDQGIFSTYLENEYALLALALEKAKDEKGNVKYNRMRIYEWLDNVRKLGINLSFAEKNTATAVIYRQHSMRQNTGNSCIPSRQQETEAFHGEYNDETGGSEAIAYPAGNVP